MLDSNLCDVSSGVSRVFFWLPRNPPPPDHVVFNQGSNTVTGTDPDRPLTFATFGNPPSDQLWIRHWSGCIQSGYRYVLFHSSACSVVLIGTLCGCDMFTAASSWLHANSSSLRLCQVCFFPCKLSNSFRPVNDSNYSHVRAHCCIPFAYADGNVLICGYSPCFLP